MHAHTHTQTYFALFAALSFTQVTYKLKLPLEELCKEVKVSVNRITYRTEHKNSYSYGCVSMYAQNRFLCIDLRTDCL